MAEAGWYDDPTGEFAFRYYNGERWTSHVIDDDDNQLRSPLRPPAPPTERRGEAVGQTGSIGAG